MAAAVLMIVFWFGFTRFDLNRDLIPVSKKEFNRLLKLR
jgi:hypothetical protein